MKSVEYIEINDNDLKSEICEKILRGLPDWFGQEQPILDYIKDVSNQFFIAVVIKGGYVGFIALNEHNEYTSEIHVMGILEEFHHVGIGSNLVKLCCKKCLDNNKKYLTVKTLSAEANCEHYDRTRKFYYKMGFLPLQVFKTLWDEENPCLFMIKNIS